MVRGKLLYSNLQISKAWYHCAIHIHSELCMGVRHLLRNYAKACPEPCDIATLSWEFKFKRSLVTKQVIVPDIIRTAYSNWLIDTVKNRGPTWWNDLDTKTMIISAKTPFANDDNDDNDNNNNDTILTAIMSLAACNCTLGLLTSINLNIVRSAVLLRLQALPNIDPSSRTL